MAPVHNQAVRAHANIARYPDHKITVILMANLKSARTQMISHRIAGMYVPAVSPPLYSAIADKEPKVTQILTDLLRQLPSGGAEPGLFTAAARTAFFPATAEMYGRYLKPLGEPTNVQLVERSESSGRSIREPTAETVGHLMLPAPAAVPAASTRATASDFHVGWPKPRFVSAT